MKKALSYLILSVLAFSSIFVSQGALASKKNSTSCLAIVASDPNAKLVRIYGGPGVVVPNAVECGHCRGMSLMPANLKDERFHIHQEKDGDRGASLECEGCGSNNPLWEISESGEIVGKAKMVQLEPKVDPKKKKRYIELPEEYRELADPNSEMNKMIQQQKVHICSSCSTTTIPPLDFDIEEHKCENCGEPFSEDRVFNTEYLMKMHAKNRETQRERQRVQPTAATATAPKKQVMEMTPEAAALIEQAKQARMAFMKKWLLGGVAAMGVLSSAAYWYNDVPVVGAGEVVSVSNSVATVQFQEGPAFIEGSDQKTYEVQVFLDERQTLPGEFPYQIQVGDAVSVHYEWSDLHILPFVFHPFTGAEFQDGSFTMGKSIDFN